jgi:hypothetical protein
MKANNDTYNNNLKTRKKRYVIIVFVILEYIDEVIDKILLGLGKVFINNVGVICRSVLNKNGIVFSFCDYLLKRKQIQNEQKMQI